MFESLQRWAFHEVAEVKGAPIAIVVVLLVGIILGIWGAGWWYTERFAVMEQRIEALQQSPPAKAPSPQPAVTGNTLSQSKSVLAIIGGGAIVLFLIGFTLGRSGPKRSQARAIAIFVHTKADEPHLVDRVQTEFAKLGWRVDAARQTDLIEHQDGIWVRGRDATERMTAYGVLHSIGIVPRIDDTGDTDLQVIVGITAAQPIRHDPEALQKEILSLVAQRMELRNALEAARAENENVRDDLTAELQRVKDGRDSFEQAWLTCKRQFGLAELVWFAQRTSMNIEKRRAEGHQLDDIGVTIRFAVYEDLTLVQQIQKILQEHTPWSVETDGSNKPTMIPLDEFKVVFVTGAMGTFEPVVRAFSQGRLITSLRDDQIATRRGDDHSGHLVIEVLPSAKK